MNDIEVGEYVRTNLGIIGKVTDRYINYPEPFELMLDKKRSLHEIEMEQKGEKIVKHSKNIIDVLEVEDIVVDDFTKLPYKISSISEGHIYHSCEMGTISFEMISSILTHEQYESNCYRLEE